MLPAHSYFLLGQEVKWDHEDGNFQMQKNYKQQQGRIYRNQLIRNQVMLRCVKPDKCRYVPTEQNQRGRS